MNGIGTQWKAPAAATLLVGALASLPALTGCAGVDTASAADAHLERFTSCAALTQYARTQALDVVTPYGLGGGGVIGLARTSALAEDSAAAGTTPAAPTAIAQKSAGTDFSATNVQEAGIDEPDIVKTDGDRIFVIAKNRLYAVDASGAAPRIAGTLDLGQERAVRDMLLAGNKLLVMSDGAVGVRPLPPAASGGAIDVPGAKRAPAADVLIAPAQAGSVLTEVDVTNPAAMTVIAALETEARYVTARLSGSTARVVVASSPTLTFTYPSEPGAAREAEALAANRTTILRTTADDWLPRFRVTSAAGITEPAPLVQCTSVSRPSVFSGLDALNVLTIDLTRGVTPIDTDAVMATGENVYASDKALYVATNRWAQFDANGALVGENTTQIHKFETVSTSETAYRGSGTVRGHLLNQFSMSEDQGNLRVATTVDGQSLVGGDAVVSSEGQPGESFVSVLVERDGKLGQIGQVGGLGKGERIFAVRFIGPRGYVVTFRQTDPLYVIDLADPSSPKVAGELKIAGYSAYLHPVAENHLIGVGQDATDQGQTKGLQVSLFDVSDPSAPRRLQQAVMPGANSEAEWDHHAFLWWAERSMAVIPFNRFDIAVPDVPPAPAPAPGTVDGGAAAPGSTGSSVAPSIAPVQQQVNGALAMTVTPQSISEAGRVSHPQDPNFGAGIRRSLVIGGTLYTVSDGGIKATALDGFGELEWLPFD